MGSKRLEQIEAAIAKITDARKSGIIYEKIAAAQAALNSPLPPDWKPEQVLAVQSQRVEEFKGVLDGQTNVVKWANAVQNGLDVVITNLESQDRLAVPPAEIDAGIDTALGIAGQAAKLFIDPETGIILRGEVVGGLKSGQQVDLAALLATKSQPTPQQELAVGIFGPKGKKIPGAVRSLIAKLNRGAEEQDLPPVVVNPGRKGYSLEPKYEILGIQRPEPTITSISAEVPVIMPPDKIKPETFSISQVLAMEGISGVLSETQTRRLTQELLAKGNLRVGVEVMEGRAQARGTSSKVVRDLELTPAGVEILRDIANQFGAQSRIRTDDVVNWLTGQKDQPVATVSQPPVDTGKRYLISQVAAQTGIPDTAIKVLHQIGALQEGTHFIQKRRVKVYTDEALKVASQVAGQAKKEDQGRFTERLIRESVGLPKEKDGENPYGPNGPKTFTVFHEHAILHRLQSCIPVIEHRIGKPLQDSFKIELAACLGELTRRLSEDDKLTISSEEQGIIRRQAAATVLEWAQNARPFNFLRGKHQGIEIGLAFIKGLKDQGQAKMIREFADAIVNPPKKIAGSIEKNGVVNEIRTVGPMGDE